MKDKLEQIKRLVEEITQELDKKEKLNLDYISVPDAAKMFGVSSMHFTRLGESGKLKLYKLSARKFYISKSELKTYIENNPMQQSDE